MLVSINVPFHVTNPLSLQRREPTVFFPHKTSINGRFWDDFGVRMKILNLLGANLEVAETVIFANYGKFLSKNGERNCVNDAMGFGALLLENIIVAYIPHATENPNYWKNVLYLVTVLGCVKKIVDPTLGRLESNPQKDLKLLEKGPGFKCVKEIN